MGADQGISLKRRDKDTFLFFSSSYYMWLPVDIYPEKRNGSLYHQARVGEQNHFPSILLIGLATSSAIKQGDLTHEDTLKYWRNELLDMMGINYDAIYHSPNVSLPFLHTAKN